MLWCSPQLVVSQTRSAAMGSWSYPCGTEALEVQIIGTGMGNRDAVTQNPATLAIDSVANVQFILAQVIVKNYTPPDTVLLSSDAGEVIRLVEPRMQSAGYHYQTVMKAATRITATVIGGACLNTPHYMGPRAFVAYVFRRTGSVRRAGGKTPAVAIYGRDLPGFVQSWTDTVTIPAASRPRTVEVSFAIADVQNDARSVILRAEAGGVVQEISRIHPNRGDELLLETITLDNVPPDATTVVATVTSPEEDGDSVYWCGLNVVTRCEEVIPVELSSFSALGLQNSIRLRWTTRSETENLGFRVLRSEDPEAPYRPLNAVLIAGAGSSATSHDYEFEDRGVEAGRSYSYKLADVDYNGTVRLHGPIIASIAAAPSVNVLRQNHPNPFNPATQIGYTLKAAGRVELSIVDVLGRRVRTLSTGHQEAGEHAVTWNGRDDRGWEVPSGVYFYRLEANGAQEVRRLLRSR